MKYSILFVLTLFLFGCRETPSDLSHDIRLFKGDAWSLAKAVEKEDTIRIIKNIEKNKNLINYQEKANGQTLLIWAVKTNHYNSAKTLLELGADTEIQDSDQYTTALMFAANKFETSKYVELLLGFGANPSSISDKCLIYKCTPLIAASKRRMESVKLLVEAGANVDYRTKYLQTALSEALTSSNIDIAYYLMIEKGAEFKRAVGKTIDGDSIYIVNDLRRCVYPLDSDEFIIKMKIVEYMKEKGVDYWETPVPKHYYNNYDSIFLEKY